MREVANKYEAVRERKRTERTVITAHVSYRRARRVAHFAYRIARREALSWGSRRQHDPTLALRTRGSLGLLHYPALVQARILLGVKGRNPKQIREWVGWNVDIRRTDDVNTETCEVDEYTHLYRIHSEPYWLGVGKTEGCLDQPSICIIPWFRPKPAIQSEIRFLCLWNHGTHLISISHYLLWVWSIQNGYKQAVFIV